MLSRKVIPEGTKDLVFEESRKREWAIKKLEKIYESFGYESIVTPTIEYYKTFFNSKDGIKEEEVYKFFDNNGRILVLRPDMTIPIARVVGTKMREVKMPIRLRYCSNVFNVNKSFGGKRNEYTDCGVEFIGDSSLGSDLEILVLALEGLKELGLDKFKLEIGNIKFFNSAFNEMGLKEEDREILANLIETKSLIELKVFLSSLNIEKKYKDFLSKLPWLFGNKEVLDNGLKLAFNEEVKESLKYMKKLYSILEKLGYGEYITFDLGMVPRVNYYTGIIFKVYLNGIGDTVLNGGRYDSLIGAYGRNLDAIGFSVNIDLLTEGIKELDKNLKFIISYGENTILRAMKEGNLLRKRGVNIEYKFISDKKDYFKVERGE